MTYHALSEWFPPIHPFILTTLEVDTVITPILEMSKMRLSAGEELG